MQACEDDRKMKWFRAAAREGFGQVDRGECEQVGEEVSREFADERAKGG
jgi:hypothetical protein